jgi:hypothetical protein
MRRLSIGVAAAGAVMATLLLPGVASAERPPYGPPEGASGPPIGACPTGGGWGLVQPSGPEHLSAAFDFNGDGWVCGSWLPAFDGSTLFSLMDNVIR